MDIEERTHRIIAGVVGGVVGAIQLLAMAWLDEQTSRPFPKEDWAQGAFVCLSVLQVFAVIALTMYRVSPWVARFLGNTYEADSIEVEGVTRRVVFQWAATIIIFLQRAVVVVSDWRVSKETAFALVIALLPLLIPSPPKLNAS